MRTTLALFILVFLLVMPASARDHDANFLIKRAGKVIGSHQVAVTETALGEIVETTIRMRVKFGPIRLFRYDHRSIEEWRDGALFWLWSETNNNGEECFVRLASGKEGFEIEGSGFSGRAPANAMPSSFWNKDVINAEVLINTQSGELITVTVAQIGRTRAPHQRPAEQYRMVGTLALDLWYDGPDWVGSNFTVDGEELTYELAPEAHDYARLEEAAG